MKMKLDNVHKVPDTAGTQHAVSGQEMAALTVFIVPATWHHFITCGESMLCKSRYSQDCGQL